MYLVEMDHKDLKEIGERKVLMVARVLKVNVDSLEEKVRHEYYCYEYTSSSVRDGKIRVVFDSDVKNVTKRNAEY